MNELRKNKRYAGKKGNVPAQLIEWVSGGRRPAAKNGINMGRRRRRI